MTLGMIRQSIHYTKNKISLETHLRVSVHSAHLLSCRQKMNGRLFQLHAHLLRVLKFYAQSQTEC